MKPIATPTSKSCDGGYQSPNTMFGVAARFLWADTRLKSPNVQIILCLTFFGTVVFFSNKVKRCSWNPSCFIWSLHSEPDLFDAKPCFMHKPFSKPMLRQQLPRPNLIELLCLSRRLCLQIVCLGKKQAGYQSEMVHVTWYFGWYPNILVGMILLYLATFSALAALWNCALFILCVNAKQILTSGFRD